MKMTLILFIISLNIFANLPAEKVLRIKRSLFSYYSNHSIETQNNDIERAIITIHGSVRNADTYFKSVWGISKKKDVEDKTLVISPHFKILGDQRYRDELVYTHEGWWIGNNSLSTSVSSFSVIDHFINILSNKRLFPNLKILIITGHSAGGHLTQRLALGSVTDLDISNLDIRYIVANPGTYAYLNNKRPVLNHPGIFEIPSNPRCKYNSWKYGLDNLNHYMKRYNTQFLIANFIKRDVTYFLGNDDRGDVEQTCEAKYQGPYRLARGKNFMDHINIAYPQNNHSIIIVPNVGHTQYGMYTSELGQVLLFE